MDEFIERTAGRAARLDMESEEQWREEADLIPFLSFPAAWSVRIVPPWEGVVVRFQVRLPSGTQKSIFLDSRNALGCFKEAEGDKPYWEAEPVPYWEVYPYRGDVGQCKRDDVERLMQMIADEAESD